MIDIKVSKQGIDVIGTAGTVPNNLIFDGQYNTFKILYQGIGTLNIGTGSNVYAVAHNAPTTPPCLTIFGKFPDGNIVQLSYANVYSYNAAYTLLDGHSVNQTWYDGTYMYFYVSSVGSPYNIPIAWYAYEPQIQ